MKLYNYNPATLEYIGDSEAELDQLESQIQNKEVYLIPQYATFYRPQKTKKNKVACFKEDKWVIEDDFRNEIYYDLETRKQVIITEIGKLKETLVKELPKDLEEERAKALKQLKEKHKEFLSQPQEQELACIDLEDLQEQVKEKDGLLEHIFSRTRNNIFFHLTIDLAKVICTRLSIIKQLSYISKWVLESKILSCTSIVELEKICLLLIIKVTKEQVDKLLNMSKEERSAYFSNITENLRG